MVIRKLVSVVWSFMGLRAPMQRIKASSSSSSYEAIASTIADAVKEGPAAMESPGGSRLAPAALEGELCCVCLSRLKEREDIRVLPCLHEFHRVCVDRWFNACRKTCPVCRFLVEDDDGEFQKREELTEEMVTWFSSFHVAGF